MAQNKAIERLMVDEGGNQYTAYIDLNTLRPVTDLSNYAVIQSGNGNMPETINYAQIPYYSFDNQTGLPVSAVTPAEEQDVTQSTPEDYEQGYAEGETDREGSVKLSAPDRNVSNNFGYKDKPGWLGALGMVPGPLGLVTKAANVAMNVNNLGAKEKARKTLGLPSMSPAQQAKGIVKDVGPTVSPKANIGGTDYGIAIGGIDDKGRLALTPNEARTRSMVLDAPVKEAGVSERGFSLRPSSETSAPASEKALGTLGQTPSGTESGTKRGLAGSYGGVQAEEKGTVPGAAFSDDMDNLPGLRAYMGEATQPTQIAGAGSFGGVAPRSVQTRGITTPSQKPQENVDLSGITTTPNKTGTVGKYDAAYGSKVDETPTGTHRPAPVDRNFLQSVQNVVGTTLGTDYKVDVTSGTYAQEKQHAINEARAEAEAAGLSKAQIDAAGKRAGQFGSTRHTTGLAADFKVTDPMGRPVTDRATLDTLGTALAAAGLSVGVGPGYMGGTAIHADDTRMENPNNWETTDPAVRSAIQDAQKESSFQRSTIANYPGGVATPADNPNKALVSEAPDVTPSTPSATGFANIPSGSMSPSSFSSLGLGRQYSPQEQAMMGMTLAGEASPKTMAGIVAGDPTALAEAGSILGTVDNRANTRRTPDVVSAITSPSQYDSMSLNQFDQTKDNFRSWAPTAMDAVSAYTSGDLKNPTPNATHMVNKSLATPSWSADMTATPGQFHAFGTPDATQTADPSAYGMGFGPVSAKGIGPVSSGVSTEGTSDTKSALSGFGHIGSDVGVSGVSKAGADTKSDTSDTDGGMSGLGGLGSTRSSSSTSGVGSSGSGLSGAGSPRGGTGFGGYGSMGYSGGSGLSGSSGSSSASKADGMTGGNSPRGGTGFGGMSGGTSGSSASKSGSAGGSASSASGGNSRGGMSSGKGQGGFN